MGRAATTTASRRRGLLNFDVAGIPSNAQVTSAAVSLYLDASQSQSSAMANYAFYVPKAFASPTWNDSGLSGSWSGGSPGTTAYGTRPLNGQSGGYTTFSGLTPVVQTWVAGTAARRGLELMQVGENVANTLYFYSSSANSANNGKRPYLEVTYTLPPQPADPYGGEEGNYTSISPTVVFDSSVSGSVQAGTPRTVTASIPNVLPDDVDRMVVVVQSYPRGPPPPSPFHHRTGAPATIPSSAPPAPPAAPPPPGLTPPRQACPPPQIRDDSTPPPGPAPPPPPPPVESSTH